MIETTTSNPWPECPECKRRHDPALPHDASSLGYQSNFMRENGRLPTFEDSWAHCSDLVKDLARSVAKAYGNDPKAIADMIWTQPKPSP